MSVEQGVLPLKPKFDGADYQPERDDPRLTGQLLRVFSLMRDGEWRTLHQMEVATGDPEASISAQLRHLRKHRFGSHTVNKEYLGRCLYHYQLVANQGDK